MKNIFNNRFAAVLLTLAVVLASCTKDNFTEMIHEVGMRFGKDKIAISVDEKADSFVEKYNEAQ